MGRIEKEVWRNGASKIESGAFGLFRKRPGSHIRGMPAMLFDEIRSPDIQG
jgi:hypothetical protein